MSPQIPLFFPSFFFSFFSMHRSISDCQAAPSHSLPPLLQVGGCNCCMLSAVGTAPNYPVLRHGGVRHAPPPSSPLGILSLSAVPALPSGLEHSVPSSPSLHLPAVCRGALWETPKFFPLPHPPSFLCLHPSSLHKSQLWRTEVRLLLFPVHTTNWGGGEVGERGGRF